MPVVRFTVQNEFGLGQPVLYGDGSVEDGDPRKVLGGVAVAGLVGILRQLGDLAEFAAEVFHGIQEQVTFTASRSQKLTSRVRQIESVLPRLEKTMLSQTSHIHFAYTAGYEWHPGIWNEHNHFIYNDLPPYIMESYEHCRDPPRLHLLDKFDIGGPRSCLRRYSDPTFFKKESSNLIEANDVKVRKDKSYRRRKKKRLSRGNRAISHAMSVSKETSWTHLSSPTDDGQTTSQAASAVGMGGTSNMQEQYDEQERPYVREQIDLQVQPHTREQSDFQEWSNTYDSRNGSGYVEYLINRGPVSKPEEKLSEGFESTPTQHADSKYSVLAEGCNEVVGDSILCSPSRDQFVPCVSSDTRYEKEGAFLQSKAEQCIKEEEAPEILKSNIGLETPERETQSQRSLDRMIVQFDEVDTVGQMPCWTQLSKTYRGPESEDEEENQSEWGSEIETGSEVDVFVDAQNTFESESDDDLDGQSKQKLENYSKDVTVHSLEDACPSNDNNPRPADIPHKDRLECPECDCLSNESSAVSYTSENDEASCVLPDPFREEPASDDKTFQELCFSLAEAVPHQEISPEVSVAISPSLRDTFLDKKEEASCALPDPTTEEAVSDDKTSQEPGESVATCCLSLGEALPDKRISPEGLVVTYPLSGEAIPDERISPEESVVKFPLLVEAVPDENREASCVLPDMVPEEMLDKKISPEEPVATYLSLGEAVPDKKILPEEPIVAYLSLGEAVLNQKGEASCVLPEPISEEAVSVGMTFQEPGESVNTCRPLLGKSLPDEKILSEEHIVAHPLSGEAVPDERILPEEPVVAYPSLGEAIPDEKISPKERVVVFPLLAAIPDKKISPEDPVTVCFPDGDHATEEPYPASNVSANERSIYGFPKPISTETTHDKAVSQVPGYALVLFDPHTSDDVDKNLKREPLAALYSPSAAGNSKLDRNSPLSCGSANSGPVPPESLVIGPVESVKIWSNGSLLGLEPSKPPVFAVPSSVDGDYVITKNSGANVLATEKTERSDKSVEVTDNFQSVPSIGNEKASLPLAVSEPNSQRTSQLGHTDGSHQQDTKLSFGVFGLSHRLFMNGFQRNSSVSNIKSLPACTNTESAMEEKTDLLCQPTHESTFLDELFGCQSLFSSPPSPPIEHMKISFSPINGFAHSKVKLKIPCKPQYYVRNMDMFCSFQLVPGVTSPHNNASDSDDDNYTFCGSSPCISDDHYSDHSASSSEMWESDESRISPSDSTSSFSQVVDRSACDGINMEPYLDLPCFDAVDPSLVTETQNQIQKKP